VKISMIPGQPAGEARIWPRSAVTRGTGLPGGVSAPGTNAGGTRVASDRRRPRDLVLAVAPQLACKKYQDMTRFAAHSGDLSGPHPAWDPV
jgi:hypothetical protein